MVIFNQDKTKEETKMWFDVEWEALEGTQFEMEFLAMLEAQREQDLESIVEEA